MSGKEVMSFEEWFEANEEGINIELAESGADREMGFDPENEYGKRYERYVANHELQKSKARCKNCGDCKCM